MTKRPFPNSAIQAMVIEAFGDPPSGVFDTRVIANRIAVEWPQLVEHPNDEFSTVSIRITRTVQRTLAKLESLRLLSVKLSRGPRPCQWRVINKNRWTVIQDLAWAILQRYCP